MRSFARSGGKALVWLSIAAAGTLGTLTIAARSPAPRTFNWGTGSAPLGLFGQRSPINRFAPLSLAILGTHYSKDLVHLLDIPVVSTPVIRPGRDGKGVSPPAPPTPQYIQDKGTLVAATRQGWKLTIDMTADRKQAQPGDVITYSMIVRNIGDQTFNRSLQLYWHTPTGTVDDNPLNCGGTPVPQSDCDNVLILKPGLGDQTLQGCAGAPVTVCNAIPAAIGNDLQTLVHNVSSNIPRIEPGGAYVLLWHVKLAALPNGTLILNHVHLAVFINGLPATLTSRTVTVIARVAAP